MNTRNSIVSVSAACAFLLLAASTLQATTINIGAPYNVLSGATAVSSTTIAAPFPASAAVDDLVRAVPPADQDHGLIFSNSDPNEQLGLSGSFGIMRKIRIWTIPVAVDNRIPNSVTVRSSLNSYGGAALITIGNFETPLGVFPLGLAAFTGTAPLTDNRYATILVDAPAGTQSLYLNFGSVGDAKGERIAEVQAFIPEPSTVVLAGLAIILAGSGLIRRRQ